VNLRQNRVKKQLDAACRWGLRLLKNVLKEAKHLLKVASEEPTRTKFDVKPFLVDKWFLNVGVVWE